MKKLITVILVISLAVFMLFSAGGCKPGPGMAERAVQEAIDRAVEEETGTAVDSTGEEVTVKTDEAEVTIGGGAKLPEGFPVVVPVYANMNILSSWKVTEDGKDAFFVSGQTSDTGKAVYDWYKSNLSGWNITNDFTLESDGQMTYSIGADNGTYEIAVWIADADGEININISVGMK